MILHRKVAWKRDCSFAGTYAVRQACKLDQKWTLERKTNGKLEVILLAALLRSLQFSWGIEGNQDKFGLKCMNFREISCDLISESKLRVLMFTDWPFLEIIR